MTTLTKLAMRRMWERLTSSTLYLTYHTVAPPTPGNEVRGDRIPVEPSEWFETADGYGRATWTRFVPPPHPPGFRWLYAALWTQAVGGDHLVFFRVEKGIPDFNIVFRLDRRDSDAK